MIPTARFTLKRRHELEEIFSKDRVIKLWRSMVKDQMRSLAVHDIHDYYDFNYSIENRVNTIIEKVLSGNYRAESPLIYRSEKKFGVCRHMMVPSPSDALVFQILTDVLYNDIITAQPSKGAYYARDRHTLKLPHEIAEAASYPWFILWPRFQKDIWKFSKSYDHLVTTDLSNYFDNIGLRELRHIISSISKTKEVCLDLLFSMIEDLSWRPDYLPVSHKGLPTINIEAMRLMGHALLFEVDHVLKARTSDSFVRWMDDINFGVNDPNDAYALLGEVNDVLKSRGLALNLSKTSILTSKQAHKHFMFDENKRLDGLSKQIKTIKTQSARTKLAKKLERELRGHLETCRARNKDKITKRYLTLLGKLKYPVALNESAKLYSSHPSLRSVVLKYLCSLPYGERTAKTFLRLYKDTQFFDDISLFEYVASIVHWSVPRTVRGKLFLKKVQAILANPEAAFPWMCQLYFLAKYGEPNEILTAVTRAQDVKATEPFFTRQAVAVLPRSLGINPARVQEIWSREVSTGKSDSASAANNLLNFYHREFPQKNDRVHFYLFPQKPQIPYPLPKFLLLCVLASSDFHRGVEVKRPSVLKYVTDPWYRHWLRRLNPAWFS